MHDGVEDARQAYQYTTRRTVLLQYATSCAMRPPTICRTAQSAHK